MAKKSKQSKGGKLNKTDAKKEVKQQGFSKAKGGYKGTV